MIKHSQYDAHCEVKNSAGFLVFCQTYCDDKMIWSKKGHFIKFFSLYSLYSLWYLHKHTPRFYERIDDCVVTANETLAISHGYFLRFFQCYVLCPNIFLKKISLLKLRPWMFILTNHLTLPLFSSLPICPRSCFRY